MAELFLKLLSIAYAGVGAATLVAYLPTIKDLYVHKKPSANIMSYAIWTITSGISFIQR